jgi:hypothetical protein
MRTTDERQSTQSPAHPGAADALARALAPTLPAPGRGLDRDERQARQALRRQIARLELRLAEAVALDLSRGARGRTDSDVAEHERGAVPRLLGLGALERRRDELVARLAEVDDRRDAERENRELLAAMYRDPAAHRGVRLETADLAERGCRVYEVRPRFGLIGLLGGWWRVKVSSGCPLSGPAPETAVAAGRRRGLQEGRSRPARAACGHDLRADLASAAAVAGCRDPGDARGGQPAFGVLRRGGGTRDEASAALDGEEDEDRGEEDRVLQDVLPQQVG